MGMMDAENAGKGTNGGKSGSSTSSNSGKSGAGYTGGGPTGGGKGTSSTPSSGKSASSGKSGAVSGSASRGASVGPGRGTSMGGPSISASSKSGGSGKTSSVAGSASKSATTAGREGTTSGPGGGANSGRGFGPSASYANDRVASAFGSSVGAGRGASVGPSMGMTTGSVGGKASSAGREGSRPGPGMGLGGGLGSFTSSAREFDRSAAGMNRGNSPGDMARGLGSAIGGRSAAPAPSFPSPDRREMDRSLMGVYRGDSPSESTRGPGTGQGSSTGPGRGSSMGGPSLFSPSRPDNLASSMSTLGRGTSATASSASSKPSMWDSIVDRIIGVESAGNASAKNPKSSATGSGQFISDTWLDMVSTYAPGLKNGRTDPQVLDLRFDSFVSRQMTKAYAIANAAKLAAAGHPVTAGNVYLSHFAGPAGANKVLNSAPNLSVSDVLGARVVRDNPFLSGKTVGWLQSWADRKMAQEPAAKQDRAPAAQPSLPTSMPVPPGRPAERFAETYLGKVAAAQVEYGKSRVTANAYANVPVGQQPAFMAWNENPVGNYAANLGAIDPRLGDVVERAREILGGQVTIGSGVRSKEDQAKAVAAGWSQTTKSDHLDGTAVDLWSVDEKGRISFAGPKQDAVVGAMKQAARELGVELEVGADWKGFKDKPHFGIKSGPAMSKERSYFGRSFTPSAATVASAEKTQMQQAARTEEAKPSTTPVGSKVTAASATAPTVPGKAEKPEKRGLGRSIAAGAVDVGLGMVPGVGMGVSLVNTGLTLAGKDTLGEMLVDRLGGGSNQSTLTVNGEGGTGRPERLPPPPPSTAKSKAPKIDVGVSRFVDIYLRPTPREKWGREGAAA